MKSNEPHRANKKRVNQFGSWCSLAEASNQPITGRSTLRDGKRRSLSRAPAAPQLVHPMGLTLGISLLLVGVLSLRQANAYKSITSSGGERMVRLCIASVDPVKLTSQCVMCNRREFPLTVIDCTGITRVNDLIASPLSVQEATCLIYNCRRQVPDVKPEPYHGSVSHAVNFRGATSSYHPSSMAVASPVSGSSIYEMMTPSGVYGGGYPVHAPNRVQSSVSASSPYMTRYGSGFSSPSSASPYDSPYSTHPRGMIGGPSLNYNKHQALPYALVPAPRTFPFGESRSYTLRGGRVKASRDKKSNL